MKKQLDPLYEDTLLFDFYSPLLTQHQRELYEEVVLGDYSLQEIASEHRISRQGVHDNVRRTKALLREYEEKLGLVEKFLLIREKTDRIRSLTKDESIRELAGEILENL